MIQNISSILKVKDHGAHGHGNPTQFFKFWAQNPMYVGCNGATCVYTCFMVVRARICGKIKILPLEIAKRDFKSA